MSNTTLLFPVVMAAAEILGAALFARSANPLQRLILACFGLGFALSIVLLDMLPDATTHYASGWMLVAAGVISAAVLMYAAGERGSSLGRSGAILGLGLHNLCEGMVLASAGSMASPLILAGAVAHKLPEGMVVFSLSNALGNAQRWALSVMLSLLIPLGTQLVMPESLRKPVLAFASGMLFVVLLKSLLILAQGENSPTRQLSRRSISAAVASGAMLAGLTCLVI